MSVSISAGLILSVAKIVFSLTEKIINYFDKKQLIDAGKAEEARDNLKESIDEISKAIRVRRNARRKFNSNGLPNNYEYYRKQD